MCEPSQMVQIKSHDIIRVGGINKAKVASS